MAKDDFVECIDLPKVRIITQSIRKMILFSFIDCLG